MNHRFGNALVAVGLLLAAAPALAHHSLQSEFDIEKSVTLAGVVTKVEWANPHIYLYLDVKDAGGKVKNWALETLPPGTLHRNGVTKQMLGVGQTVSILAYQAKDGSNLAVLRTITFSDGHTIEIWLGDGSKNP